MSDERTEIQIAQATASGHRLSIEHDLSQLDDYHDADRFQKLTVLQTRAALISAWCDALATMNTLQNNLDALDRAEDPAQPF